jgi:WD40 repeat protein
LIVAAVAVAVAAGQLAVGSTSARAGAYQGENGRIVYVSAGDVFSMNPDGTGITDLTQHPALRPDHVSVSPDGTRIALTVDYLSDHDEAGLWVMDADGTHLSNVLGAQSAQFISVTGPTWSPDGTQLAFSGFDMSDANELWVVGADGSNLREITRCDCVDFQPAWSPKGDRIAWPDGANIDFAYPGSGATSTIPVGSQLDGDRRLSWSPDGQYLAFDNYTFYSGIWRIGADGSGLAQIVSSTGDYVVEDPAFSPDGTEIAVELFDGSKSQIYLVDAATFVLASQPVASTISDMFYPDWGTPPPTPTSVALQVAPADPVTLGTVSTLTATVSPAAGGTVQFLRDGVGLGAPVTVSGGVAAAEVSLPAGASTVTAAYSPADPAHYAASTSAARSYLVLDVPRVTGTVRVGHTVTCSGTPGGVQTFAWYRDGTAVTGATGATLTLTPGYYRSALACGQTVTKDSTSVSQTSASVTVAIGDPLRYTTRPSFTGTVRVGYTQTARHGSWTPKATAYGYRWLRDGSPIRGATYRTYRLVRADRGHKISVRVTAERYGYRNGVARSAAKLIRG